VQGPVKSFLLPRTKGFFTAPLDCPGEFTYQRNEILGPLSGTEEPIISRLPPGFSAVKKIARDLEG